MKQAQLVEPVSQQKSAGPLFAAYWIESQGVLKQCPDEAKDDHKAEFPSQEKLWV